MLLTLILQMEAEGLMLPPEEIDKNVFKTKLQYTFNALVNNAIALAETTE